MRATALMLCVAFLASCGGGHSSRSAAETDGEALGLRHAEHLTVSRHPGYTEVTVRNPWDTLRTLQRYLLVPRDSAMPASLPQGTVIRTPVGNALVYSAVHTGLLTELGALDAIGGVCSPEYINDPEIASRIVSGRIVDCGSSQNPTIERVMQLRPDVVMLSPYENNDKYSKIGELGIPVLECADYMEPTPLGRAEWMRFYGLLVGRGEEADSMFADTKTAYLHLRQLAAEAKEHPTVIFDQRYGQAWNVPAANSTTGRLIEDAGGVNPFARFTKAGSVALAPEKVLGEAHQADVWFVRYNQKDEKTLAELAADAAVNPQFKAFKEGRVYGCNTAYVDLFEETPFHPECLLRDMVIIMHPGLLGDEEPVYYRKMK